MNYIYLAVGLIAGIFFLGKARSTSRRKMIPYEVTRELKSSNRMDEYNRWCNSESKADVIVGMGLILFGFSVTFADTNPVITNILSILSLIVFVVGYIMRFINNKKHLGHLFVK